jgi:hypothetical protein
MIDELVDFRAIIVQVPDESESIYKTEGPEAFIALETAKVYQPLPIAPSQISFRFVRDCVSILRNNTLAEDCAKRDLRQERLRV